ncbi:MAG: DUF4998 domain-containing protein, partial [Prevotellaceae bacterium]|nr:DUF4998 domain-containing protein [Prevotellaceae bacterium]
RAWVYWAVGSDSRITKTVIEYTFNGETKTVEKNVPVVDDTYISSYRADSLLINGLDEGYYSFSMYTVDNEGHRSITTPLYPQIVQIYGNVYLNSVSPRGVEKMEMQAGGDLKITWSKPASDVLYSIVEYQDHSKSSGGVPKIDTLYNDLNENVLKGFKRYKTFSVKSYLQVGIDVAPVEAFYAPPVVENVILVNNGLAEYTDAALGAITSLAFPLGIETWTLKDLYYFPNLHTLDLTPGTEALPEYTYFRTYVDYNSASYQYDTTRYTSKIGGGDWLNFVSGYMRDSDTAIISDLLRSGQLTKVKYTRNSYPGLDPVLKQYGNAIEWNPVEELPDDLMFPNNLLVDYKVEDRNRGAVSPDYKSDGSNIPAAIKEQFTGNNLSNAYVVKLDGTYNEGRNLPNLIAFSLPEGVRFNAKEHKYLKFDAYIHIANSNYNWMHSSVYSSYAGYKAIKFTRRNKPSNFPDSSPYNYTASYSCTFADAELGAWKSFTLDMSNDPEVYYVPIPHHGRVLEVQLGADNGAWGQGLTDWDVQQNNWGKANAAYTLTYYIANLRWSNVAE